MSNTKNKVAYIVVCWNNAEIIGGCLESILNQTYKHKSIYIIDNNSSDESADFIATNFPQVKLVRSKENTGFAKGNNILIKEALKDEDVGYIALINSDATIDTHWTQEIVSYVAKKDRVACAQGLTVDYFDHTTVDAEHVYVGENFQSVQFGYGEKVKAGFLYPRKVFGVNAAAAMYTRSFIETQKNNQLFDEKFYMYLEDVDVCFRAIIEGWNNYSIPSAKAYHMGSVSMKKRSSDYNIYMTFRNQSALLVKNLPFRTFIRFMPTALRFERNFYRHLQKTGGRQLKKTALKGRFVGLLRVPLYLADRIYIQSRRNIEPAQLERAMKNHGLF